MLGLVGLFPGELRLVAAEVAAGGRLAIDRPAQVEVLDDARRREREDFADQLAEPRVVDLAGAFGVDVDAHRLGNADRVGELHFAAVGQARGDDVLRHVAGHVGGAAVDLGRVLAAERAAAVAAPAAVGVDDDLAAGEAAVAVRAADHEPAGRVDVVRDVVADPFAERRLDDLLDDELVDFCVRDVGRVLRRDDDRVDADRRVAVVLDRDLALASRAGASSTSPFLRASVSRLRMRCDSAIGSGISSWVSLQA